MNNYKINITISNNFGELIDKQMEFGTFNDMQIFFWKHNPMDGIFDDARNNGMKDNMMPEEVYDCKEDADMDKEYVEDLSENSPLNNPANFVN